MGTERIYGYTEEQIAKADAAIAEGRVLFDFARNGHVWFTVLGSEHYPVLYDLEKAECKSCCCMAFVIGLPCWHRLSVMKFVENRKGENAWNSQKKN